MELIFGNQVILAYKRLSYTPWHAIAEFVDNSTQAYFSNREVLDASYERSDEMLTVAINYDRSAERWTVSDNSFGMREETLARAMVVGHPPEDASGRSRYGMGLKTAACWLGNLWTVRTTQLGIDTEYSITVDVGKIAAGETELPITEASAAPGAHHTVIEITRLNRGFYGRTLGKIRGHLGSMYREDIREGILRLEWQGEQIQWVESDDRFLADSSGRPARRHFSFAANGKRVEGWAGVLAKGSRADAGFSILHNGRVIKGWPVSWRPQEIYGQVEGSNDLVNQRLVGEIRLNDFDVTHTKDDIQWSEGEQDTVERLLRSEIEDLITLARNTRVRPKAGPGRGPIQNATRELQSTLRATTDVEPLGNDVALIRADDIARVVDRYRDLKPHITAVIDSVQVLVYLADEESPSATFISLDTMETGQQTVRIVANLKHPFLYAVTSTEALNVYMKTVLAQVLASRDDLEDQDHRVLVLRQDQIMRAMSQTGDVNDLTT
jgi:hypothetical protein